MVALEVGAPSLKMAIRQVWTSLARKGAEDTKVATRSLMSSVAFRDSSRASGPGGTQRNPENRKATRWYSQQPLEGGDEAFYPGRHKTFIELELDRRYKSLPETALTNRKRSMPYNCTPDANLLNDKNLYYKFPVSTLRHVTNESDGNRIVEDGGFRGLDKKVATVSPLQNYSWWSAHYKRGELERERAEITAIRASGYDGPLQNGLFEPSNPFMDKAYLKKYAFSYPFNELMDEYKEQFCSGEDPVLRILGTFVYNQEIMHTVVVHALESNDLFRHLPKVTDSGNRVFFQESDGVGRQKVLYWCPESIIRRTTFPWSPWERLSVAFRLPEVRPSLLRTKNLLEHRSLVQNE